jgi:flagellar basal-body rod modification protein FlgD
MNISTIDRLNKGTQTNKTTEKSDELGQSAYLKLLTEQLKYQDPTEPTDNKDMLAQLAQFSNVTGTAEINQSLKDIKEFFIGNRVGDAANWIGKSALVTGDKAGMLTDGSFAGEISLAQDAAKLQINLLDADGRVVHSEEFGATKQGTVAFAWDNRDAAGNLIAQGPLKIQVNATDGSSKQLNVTSAGWAQVSGVQSPASGQTKLITDIGTIDPTEASKLS